VVMTPDKKKEIIENFKMHPSDTGSPEVQIALLSERINYLTEHFKIHKERPPFATRSSETGGTTAAVAQLPQEKRMWIATIPSSSDWAPPIASAGLFYTVVAGRPTKK